MAVNNLQNTGVEMGKYNTCTKNQVAEQCYIEIKIANLISKLNFYKLIPYPMDNSLSGRRRPARQTSEKDVLCLHWQIGP